VVFLINSMGGGGAERVMANLANYLHRTRGWRITILTLRGGPVQYPLDPAIEVRALHTAPLNAGPFRLFGLPLFAAEVAWQLRRYSPDAVMGFLVRSNLTLVLSRWFGNRRRIFISERCATDAVYRGDSLESRTMLRLVAAVYPYADRIVAISRGVKDSLVRLGIASDKVRVIYNPQNLGSIASAIAGVSSRPPVSSGPFTIVTAGRLSPQKDYPTLLQALREVCDSGVDARLIVLGNGPDHAKLMKLAERLKIGSRIEWRGWLSDPYPVMAAGDLFVLTSRWEGFGNVLVEAMACGVPVVATSSPGTREIVAVGADGLLVDHHEPAALAAALERVLSDQALHTRLAHGARASAERFALPAIAAAYDRVLGAMVQ
jgi:glycosyltransferase involved in cell wall biosynthesis